MKTPIILGIVVAATIAILVYVFWHPANAPASGTAGDLKRDATKGVHDGYDATRDTLRDGANATRDAVKDGAEAVSDAARKAKESARDAVK